ncbi:MAG TPA: hypothetical protein VGR66_05005, partial [Candidatus Eisenbacteria bacterium]|nr:hypothetical protein [Candidatus Eisenbacteria bacterium]
MTGRAWIPVFIVPLVVLGLGAMITSSFGFPSVKDISKKAEKAVEKKKPEEQKPADASSGQGGSASSASAASGKVSDVST